MALLDVLKYAAAEMEGLESDLETYKQRKRCCLVDGRARAHNKKTKISP